MDILNGFRVVEYATEISGPYCGKVFVDVGADVVKVESADGDVFRRRGSGRRDGEDGALFRFLNAGKRSVVLNPTDPEFYELLGTSDLLIESFGGTVFEPAVLRRRFPGLVIVSVTHFGTTGHVEHAPSTPFTVEAESGAMSTRGRLDQPPIQVGGRLFEWLMGAYASVAALAAVRKAKKTGEGEYIDCSLMEVCHIGGSGIEALAYELAGRPPISAPSRLVELPSIEPTIDGWIGVNTNTRQQFDSFLTMIGRLDLLDEDESWAMARTRTDRMDEWNAIVHAWTEKHTTAEIVELASLLRIPVAEVNNGKTVLEHPHFQARGLWNQADDGSFTCPVPQYQIDGERPRVGVSAPTLGQHQGEIEARQRVRYSGSVGRNRLPLSDIRVIDATAWWAGPSSSQVLAALGADVIHLESIQHPDGARMAGVVVSDEKPWWEFSPLFLRSNTNKRGLTLDLGSPQGAEVLKKLVANSDIFVENFSPRVIDNFGLTWDALREINPRLVMARMPAFGLDGPWRDNVGFAQTMEQLTGLAWVTGHEYDQPRVPRGPCDPMAGMSAAFAMILGLERRDVTGHGSFIEVAMVESALNAAAEQVIEFTAYGNVMQRHGNRSPEAAPQGLYACQGSENWLALSVASDAQWISLTHVLGNPVWADDSALDTVVGRQEAHDLIDDHLAIWAQKRTVEEAVEQLRANGVPAAKLWDARLSPTHPQMAARKFFEEVDHPIVGRHIVSSLPFRFESVDRWCRTGAPLMGQDNHDILIEDLSLKETDVAELTARGVIGTRLASGEAT
jgi:crotonobetainyl-CoA:carnitine CoA-transferase CaiB-like acyl-CoA transferase